MKQPEPLEALLGEIDQTKGLIELWQVLMEYESPERVEAFFRAIYRWREELPVEGDKPPARTTFS